MGSATSLQEKIARSLALDGFRVQPGTVRFEPGEDNIGPRLREERARRKALGYKWTGKISPDSDEICAVCHKHLICSPRVTFHAEQAGEWSGFLGVCPDRVECHKRMREQNTRIDKTLAEHVVLEEEA